MKVLVTGASGFIGQSLVARLLAMGHTVRALYRRQELGPLLTREAAQYPQGLELLRCNLEFPQTLPSPALRQSCFGLARRLIPENLPAWPVAAADLAQAESWMAGMDACVHIAAKVGDWGSDEAFFSANVNPARVLLAAAEAARLKKFVYISSISVHGFGHSRNSSETGPYFRAGNPYQLSKRCAESLVNQAASGGLDTCIIRPGNVYGPGDTTTFYPIFDALLRGLMGTLAGGRYLTCPVYIDDLVSAMVGALGPVAGAARTFNITSGEQVSWRELVDLSCDALGIRRSTLDLPGFLARGAAWLLETGFKLAAATTAPPLTGYRVEQLLHDYNFSVATAESGFGWKPAIALPDGLRNTVTAYRIARNRDGGDKNAG